MLHIILLILKIIGVLLLILLGLLLLILLTVLLVPIRYRVNAEHGEEFCLEGGANWLLHIINARFTHIEGVFHIRVRVLWFLLYDNLKPRLRKPKVKRAKKKRRRQRAKRTSQKVKTNVKKEIKQSERITDDIRGEKLEIKQKTKLETKELHPQEEKIVIKGQDKEEPLIEDSIIKGEKKKLSFLQKLINKIKNIKVKIISFFRKLKEKISKMFEAVGNIRKKFGLISDFLQDTYNREGFQVTFKSLKKLLKHILPKKLRSRIIFGTGDPCTTGQALGFMGILYSFYGDRIVIIPDFENKVFEGKHYARGRIRLVTILIIVIKLIRDRRFKNLKRNFQILKEAL